MYESYTHQAVPSKRYRELLGTALCVFNSNNSFVIENILNKDTNRKYSWYELIDKTSGQLEDAIKVTITQASDEKIANTFKDLYLIRNRIMHGYQVTAEMDLPGDDAKQILATKYKNGYQEYITEEFLMNFIKKNDEFAAMLEEFRRR
ncbi:hypothetical protein UYSO10_2463 [Kosakonia radicincitans]|uniref:selenium binding protein n=1 Tax=Kosakonia radicincitans TaxID=283686 RepID=UPI001183E2CF|nr:selenium binding protein [Kosakonia radicincitans]VVT48705.1 hypothetical protein UYSO10_2463 [Kosakonia radicincitans]